ncbi:MAG: hypothetical protein H6741_07555 [Alphaproteobacteria bacterium]|nr:hypothetical protein [Alphaproteobacteria bacterium]MCB9792571.1 hypothetical protein [Alphaproteobacteria bacterium]
MTHRLALLLPLGLLAGCEQIDAFKGVVEGLANPMVTQAVLLGVEQPQSEDVDLSGTDFGDGATIQVFLADAASVDDIENAPVSGADVQVRVGDVAAVFLTEDTDGAYSATGGDGLDYTNNAETVLTIDYADDTHRMTSTLPAAVNADVPSTHSANTAMNVDLGGTYDAVLSVVVNGASGEVTWSNMPEGPREYYDLTHGEGGVSSLTIPAGAFPSGCACAVGIAGLENAQTADLDNVNTALSSFTTGKMKFHAVVVP